MSHGDGLRRATKERRTCALGYARGFDFVRRPDKLPRAGSAESAHRHKAHHVIRIPHSLPILTAQPHPTFADADRNLKVSCRTVKT